jgi:nucleotide-binding universal stress UspA family protein
VPATKEGEEMSIFPTKILLATDGSEEARQATQAAAELSKETGSEVHIAYVLPSPSELRGHHLYSQEVMRSVLEQAEGEANSFLEEQAKQLGASGGKVGETHLRAGEPDKEIVKLSEELGVGTIVIGSRGLGAVRRALMGGVSESVVRHAHCPVFVVRGDGAR